jgi:hypothetical protein
MVLTAGEGIDMGTIGSLARSFAPAGGVAPLAGQVEYRWPISQEANDAGSIDDDELLGVLFEGGDIRVQWCDLAMTAPLLELQDAYQLAAALPGWADGACSSVEQEIVAGHLGEAAKQWATSAFGLTRLFLATGLKDQTAGPAGLALTALVLLHIRNKIRDLRQLLPAGNFEVLNSPLVAPPFLVDFLGR